MLYHLLSKKNLPPVFSRSSLQNGRSWTLDYLSFHLDIGHRVVCLDSLLLQVVVIVHTHILLVPMSGLRLPSSSSPTSGLKQSEGFLLDFFIIYIELQKMYCRSKGNFGWCSSTGKVWVMILKSFSPTPHLVFLYHLKDGVLFHCVMLR